jgi:VWFA-related protein
MSSTRLWTMAGTLLLASLSVAGGQEVQAPPTFPRGVELVKVDVVVTDKAGNHVSGLTKEDFTVLDEGQPREIATFQAIQLPPATLAAPVAERARPHLATNAVREAALPGRTYVIVLDNLHLTPLNAQRAKGAVATFLDKGVGDGDRVTLIATGGGPWWTTTLPQGRAELQGLLKSLEARRFPEGGQDRLTDYEAMRIYVDHDTLLANRVQSRLDTFGSGKSRQQSEQMQQQREQTTPGAIDPFIDNKATQAYLTIRTRMRVTLSVLERVMKSLAGTSDRKAVLLVSEGFVFDRSEDGFKGVTEAARRSNASLYFLDTKGLEAAGSFYSAQFGAPIDERDVLSAIADTTRDGDGSDILAQDTGGFSVRSTNDLSPGILRIGSESRNYYLIGFDPPSETPRDGRFRKITVRVRSRNVTVRARKGYYAPRDETTIANGKEKEKEGDPQIQAALDSPYPESAIPLRATAFVTQEGTSGRARTLVAADADVSVATFRSGADLPTASLDLLIVVANRKTGEVNRYDQKVDVARQPKAQGGPTWYSIVRDFDLAPGSYQARIVVRDAQSHRLGTVAYDFEVPPLDQWWISTPVLTDTIQQTPGQQGVLAPVLVARRTFAAGAVLYCRFEVNGAARDKASGLPRVSSGHRLRRIDGTVVSKNDPTPILPTSLGAVARMIGIPLDGVSPGEYELVLTVKDEITGSTKEIVEPLVVEARIAQTRGPTPGR